MNTERDMIGETVNRMFAEHVDRKLLDDVESGAWPAELWKLVDESGFSEVLSPEAEWQNAYPVFHAIGFHRVPLPLAETIIARALLAMAGLQSRAGPLTLIEQDDRLMLQVESGCLVVNGAAVSIPWARHAKHAIIAGRVGTRRLLGVVDISTTGVQISRADNIAHEPRDSISFSNTHCAEYTELSNRVSDRPVTLFGALARAAMIVGAAQSVLQQSVQYANERVQFGKPIGKYQAIQHALAILAGEVACAQTATMAACEAARGAPSVFDVAVAKIRSGQTAGLSANIAHQVHGAFGFTHEHTLHYATRRLWSWRAEYGAESVWAACLGRQFIARGGDHFWPALVARQS